MCVANDRCSINRCSRLIQETNRIFIRPIGFFHGIFRIPCFLELFRIEWQRDVGFYHDKSLRYTHTHISISMHMQGPIILVLSNDRSIGSQLFRPYIYICVCGSRDEDITSLWPLDSGQHVIPWKDMHDRHWIIIFVTSYTHTFSHTCLIDGTVVIVLVTVVIVFLRGRISFVGRTLFLFPLEVIPLAI